MARILLGVTGGIAAYKALVLVRLATKAGHAVRVVQTSSSLRFVGQASFAALTGAPVLSDAFERDPLRGAYPGDPAATARDHDPIGHLELVARADALVIAPATADAIARLAHGMADDLLTTAALAATCPLVIAPAMNVHMLEHPATRANLALLRERGAIVVDPEEGELASRGEWGAGRLAAPQAILEATLAALAARAPRSGSEAGDHRHLLGLRVLVTAGGTREPIDAVRYVGNRSSGRMGFALAEEAAALGADVTVIAANVALQRRPGLRYVDVATAAELQEACAAEAARADVVLMAAAVADYRPRRPLDGKVDKSDQAELVIELERTPDILATLARDRRDAQTIVGFAAEHGPGAIDRARKKLTAKGVDAIVVNDVGRTDIGFDVADNEVTILTASGEHAVARAPKPEVARAILATVIELRRVSGGPASIA